MENIQLVSIWKAERHKDQSVQLHAHNYCELVYYTKGTGKTDVDGTLYTFQPSTFMLIPPKIHHNEVHFSGGEVICLGFLTDATLPQALFADPSLTILNVLQDILQEASTQRFGYKALITAKLTELLIMILRLQKNAPANTKNFEYIIRYISENYHEKILLSDCARQLNISYDYFQHRFKELTGYSPQAFLLQQRLNGATQMLQQGNHSCTEIAYRCGFSTSAQFSMQFKRAMGVSPLQYRNMHK